MQVIFTKIRVKPELFPSPTYLWDDGTYVAYNKGKELQTFFEIHVNEQKNSKQHIICWILLSTVVGKLSKNCRISLLSINPLRCLDYVKHLFALRIIHTRPLNWAIEEI